MNPPDEGTLRLHGSSSYRLNATVAGALLLTALVAGILSLPFSGIINEPDYLVKAAANGNRLMFGALLELIMAFACAGIAIWLYPVLRRENETLALGAAGFRIIEAALFLVATAGLISILKLSQAYVNSGAADSTYYHNLGTIILSVRDWASFVTGAIAFGLGAMLYYYIFYRSRLIPRWLSGWGLAAIALHIVAAVATIFGDDQFTATTAVLNMPIAANEAVLAIWLIVRGFDPAHLSAESG